VQVPKAKRSRAKTPEPPAQKKRATAVSGDVVPEVVVSADAIPQVGDEVEFQSFQGCKLAELFADGSAQVAITGLGRMKAQPGQWKLKGQMAVDAD